MNRETAIGIFQELYPDVNTNKEDMNDLIRETDYNILLYADNLPNFDRIKSILDAHYIPLSNVYFVVLYGHPYLKFYK